MYVFLAAIVIVPELIGDLSDREKVLIGLDLLFDELTETEYSGDK